MMIGMERRLDAILSQVDWMLAGGPRGQRGRRMAFAELEGLIDGYLLGIAWPERVWA